jgi:hypothetical protein
MDKSAVSRAPKRIFPNNMARAEMQRRITWKTGGVSKAKVNARASQAEHI